MAAGNDGAARAYPLRNPAWDDVPHLVHGFLGRAHGLAPGPFTIGDLHRALRAAGEEPARVLAARQVHGSETIGPEPFGPLGGNAGDFARAGPSLPVADALVSASADAVLAIRTADCVPILLVARRARAVAAVHAGWRGLLAGVVAAAVTALAERYGAAGGEVEAAIGPAIGGCCYEFGAEHRPSFVAAFGAEAAAAWEPARDGGRPHLDLRRLCRLALERAEVPAPAIATLGPCTAEHPGELHSYRRDGADAGRQLSYVGWRT